MKIKKGGSVVHNTTKYKKKKSKSKFIKRLSKPTKNEDLPHIDSVYKTPEPKKDFRIVHKGNSVKTKWVNISEPHSKTESELSKNNEQSVFRTPVNK